MKYKLNSILQKPHITILLYWLLFISYITKNEMLYLLPMQIVELFILAISITLILQGFKKIARGKYQLVLLIAGVLQSTFVMYWWLSIRISYTLYLGSLILGAFVVSLVNHLSTKKSTNGCESVLKGCFVFIILGLIIFISAYFQIFILYYLF